MEASAEKTSEDTSATPENKQSCEYLLACAMMNESIPDFWLSHPREWFFKFEAYMSLQNQDDDDQYKFDIAVTKLKDDKAIEAIADLILTPLKTGKYQALKKRLIDVFLLPKENVEKKKELKSSLDCKTNCLMEQSELLRRIEKLLSDVCEILRHDGSSSGGKGQWLCWNHWRFGSRATKCADKTHCNFD